MSQILRALVLAGYSALIIHFIRILNKHEEEIEIVYVSRPPNSLKKILREIKKHKNVSYTFVDMNFKMPTRLPTDLKYVLKWTQAFSHYNTKQFVSGQIPFFENNCTHSNCYMTNDKSLLMDPRYFDAILFDAENDWDLHPVIRTPRQKYIFTASEPANLYPVCHPAYDSFYNWTWSYKLNSDIVQTFFSIYHKNGTIAGPKVNMQWITDTKRITPSIKGKLMFKNKMAAWFVSHCNTKSGRENVVEELIKSLSMYNFTVDIYGWCGKLVCPKDNLDDCLELLQNEYYFYLAFENSLCEDYVTEKVLYALNHYTVPIVYGGANYSRFLPPNSYIDARTMEPASLASLMIEIMKSPRMYEDYFRWHKYYNYVGNSKASEDVCKLCEILNDPEQKHSQVKNFRKWWNTQSDACKDDEKKGHIFHL